jgi:hypothetical protein
MRACRFLVGFLGLAIALFGWATPASAIILEMDDGSKVVGVFDHEDDKRVFVKIKKGDDEPFVKGFNRDKIVRTISEVNEKTLATFSSRSPKDYWEYAEKLAEHPEDPEAKGMMKHLYLIAATLDKQKYGSKGLLKLSAMLTDKPAEARKCRALAFMLDRNANAAEVLKEDAAKSAPPDKAALQNFVKALQLYRAGQGDAASEITKLAGVEKVFSQSGILGVKVFRKWCSEAADPRPDDAIRLVLQAELWALNPRRGSDDSSEKEAADPTSWSAILQSHGENPVSPLSLETFKIDGMNGRKCHRQNREWVEE